MKGGNEDFQYTQERIDAYVESDGCLAWAIAMDFESPAFGRIMNVRTAVPENQA